MIYYFYLEDFVILPHKPHLLRVEVQMGEQESAFKTQEGIGVKGYQEHSKGRGDQSLLSGTRSKPWIKASNETKKKFTVLQKC